MLKKVAKNVPILQGVGFLANQLPFVVLGRL